jgi:hypothetical protein
MVNQYSRRAILGAIALSGMSGCLTRWNFNAATEAENAGEECHVETGRWQGTGDQITTTQEVTQEEVSVEKCAKAAAAAAFDELNERLDISLGGSDWVSHGVRYDGEYTSIVSITYIVDRDGNVQTCPAPAFDVAAARAKLPSEVTVTLEVDQSDESHECTRQIELVVERLQYD